MLDIVNGAESRMQIVVPRFIVPGVYFVMYMINHQSYLERKKVLWEMQERYCKVAWRMSSSNFLKVQHGTV